MAEYSVMKDLQGYFTMDQIDSIISHTKRERDKLLFLLLSRTGRRITEVVGRKEYIHRNNNKNIEKRYAAVKGLTPQDINPDGSIIFNIVKKKYPTKSIKVIDTETLNMLYDYIERNDIQEDEPVFNITRFRAYQVLKESCAAAGIYRVGERTPHPHNFRHSFAVHILKNSKDPTDIKKVSKLLEHSNINITSHYLQFSQEDVKELIENTFNKKKVSDSALEEKNDR